MRPAIFPAGRAIRVQPRFSRRCSLHIRQLFVSVGPAEQPTRTGRFFNRAEPAAVCNVWWGRLACRRAGEKTPQFGAGLLTPPRPPTGALRYVRETCVRGEWLGPPLFAAVPETGHNRLHNSLTIDGAVKGPESWAAGRGQFEGRAARRMTRRCVKRPPARAHNHSSGSLSPAR
jgi:hypothetical protein